MHHALRITALRKKTERSLSDYLIITQSHQTSFPKNEGGLRFYYTANSTCFLSISIRQRSYLWIRGTRCREA